MNTNSYIGVECDDGIRAIYCHLNGYLEHVGVCLKNHYSDFFKVCELINGGNISSLDKDIGKKHSFDDRKDGWTTYYGRDRGEVYQEYKVFETEEKYVDCAMNCWAEYIYLFKNGKWYYTQSDVESFKEI